MDGVPGHQKALARHDEASETATSVQVAPRMPYTPRPYSKYYSFQGVTCFRSTIETQLNN